jgi:hypothetical protein
VIEGNEIIYCAIGIGSDLSPFQPDSTIWMRNNRFAYNGIASSSPANWAATSSPTMFSKAT